MNLLERIQNEIVVAMKAKDELRLATLRSIKTALDKVSKEKPLDEQTEHKILESLAKQRQESITAFTDGNRPELAEKEKNEHGIILGFLPDSASIEEIEGAINKAFEETKASTIKHMGSVLSHVRSTLAGKRIDAQNLAAKVKEKLS